MSDRVLYMEDDDAQARLVQKCLERAGYSVDLVGDGAAGPGRLRRRTATTRSSSIRPCRASAAWK